MGKVNNEIECPYYQYAIVNEDGDDFYDLCYGAEKGEYCCDEENKNCLYRQLQQLKVENEELKEIIDELFSIKIPVISQGINETDEDYKQRILKTMKIKEVKNDN